MKNYLFAGVFLLISFVGYSQKTEYIDYTLELINKGSSHTKVNSSSKALITQNNASSIRLFFKEANLGKSSYIKVTSLLDGEAQILDTTTLQKWNNSTAYFNGSNISVELIKGSKDHYVSAKLDYIQIENHQPHITSKRVCDMDDRVSSNHKAVGRLSPGGGTAWIAPNGVYITAAHVFKIADGRQGLVLNTILEFNVPLSNSNGAVNHPPVKDQYPITRFYIPSLPNEATASNNDDWAVIDVGRNSNGQTPFEAQGESIPISNETVLASDIVRVIGYGLDDGISNNTQQESTGAVSSNPNQRGTSLGFLADVRSGNSGGPVINIRTGNAIGVVSFERGAPCDISSPPNFAQTFKSNEFYNLARTGNGCNGTPAPVTLLGRNKTNCDVTFVSRSTGETLASFESSKPQTRNRLEFFNTTVQDMIDIKDHEGNVIKTIQVSCDEGISLSPNFDIDVCNNLSPAPSSLLYNLVNNPVTTVLSVTLNRFPLGLSIQFSPSPHPYQIIDLNGQVLLNGTMSGSEMVTNIDVNALSKGMYILKINLNNPRLGQDQDLKFVVN